jgi:Sensors of blue-light using FAD
MAVTSASTARQNDVFHARPLASVPTASMLSTLTYQSRAVAPFTDEALHLLLRAAQTRNRAADVTGLMIYDDGRFFQCLEGPAETLEIIWRSIQQDPRHTDIELLGTAPTSTRFFANWDMRLAQSAAHNRMMRSDSMYVAPAVVELLHRTPYAAPKILAMLVATAAESSTEMPTQKDADRAILAEIVQRVVVPQLAVAHGMASSISLDGRSHANISEFTHLSQLSQLPRLLLAADPSRAFQMIADAYAAGHSLGELCATLLEPTARSLGDMWQTDDCSEVDVTLGLCRMQMAVRRLDFSSTPAPVQVGNAHAALFTPQPGESHMLGATTHAEMLWQAGWNTRVEFPATDEALQSLVSDTWFDSLDLSMSPAFCREDWRARMKASIAAARLASKNPALAIVVSGRLAFEQSDTAQHVGANAGARTALQIESVMLESLRPAGGE